jgi:hypothetical protein
MWMGDCAVAGLAVGYLMRGRSCPVRRPSSPERHALDSNNICDYILPRRVAISM